MTGAFGRSSWWGRLRRCGRGPRRPMAPRAHVLRRMDRHYVPVSLVSFGKDIGSLAALHASSLPDGRRRLVAPPVAQRASRTTGRPHRKPAAIAMLLAIHLWLARLVVLPRVDGFEAIIAAIQADPGPERASILVALDAIDSTLFTCFVRLDDPGFRLRVLPHPGSGSSRESRPRRSRDICRDRGRSDRIAARALRLPLACCHGRLGAGTSSPGPSDRRLRAALRLPRFQLVRTFAIGGTLFRPRSCSTGRSAQSGTSPTWSAKPTAEPLQWTGLYATPSPKIDSQKQRPTSLQPESEP